MLRKNLMVGLLSALLALGAVACSSDSGGGTETETGGTTGGETATESAS
jgi:hypothetical protein